jgi:uncharacterized delta-60 repeat protein
MKTAVKILFSLFIFLTFIRAVTGAGVDHTFNPFVIETDFSVVNVITVQPDGKYLVGGRFNTAGGVARSSLARFNADGTIDRSFVSSFNGEPVNSIIVQGDDRILIGGEIIATLNGSTRRGLLRLNSDGSLDPTFFNGPGIQGIETMAAQPDGKIQVGDVSGTIDGVAIQGLARFNTDGSFDSTFRPPAGTAFSVIALPDGKIMTCGAFSIPSVNNSMVRLNNDGSWDPSFSIISNPQISILKLLSNGKILLGGRFTMINEMERFKIVRLNADGTLDDSFVSGIPYTLNNPEPFVFVEQPDGKILVGGGSSPFQEHISIYRLSINGSLDASFSIPQLWSPVLTVGLLSSGQIIIGGGSPSGFYSPYHNPVMRLGADGNIDTSFTGSVGYATFVDAFGESPDGKIYIGGDFYEVNGQTHQRIARLNPNGTLDPTFNKDASANDQIRDLAVQPDGKVVIVGDFGGVNGATRSRLACLNPDGTLDVSFNPGQGADNAINEIALQADGKIIIGGVFTHYGGLPRKFVARVNPDGSVDKTFDIGSPGPSNAIFEIVPLPDGKTLIGGAIGSINGVIKGNIARLNSDGTMDASFNAGGTGVGAPPNVVRSVSAILVQSDGKIIIGGGFSTYNDVPRSSLARLNSDGSLDSSFTTGTQGGVSVLAQKANGQILVGGGFSSIGGVPQNRFARLNGDGSVDTSFDIGLGPDQAIYRMIAKTNGNILNCRRVS